MPLTHSSLRFKTSNALCSEEESDLCRFEEIGFAAWTHYRALARHCVCSSSLGLNRIARYSNIATEIRGQVFARFAL